MEVAALSSAILRRQVVQIGCSPPQPARDDSHTWCKKDLGKLESRESREAPQELAKGVSDMF